VRSKEDAQAYALFETNHPSASMRMIAKLLTLKLSASTWLSRMVRRYRHRWGIENGYKTNQDVPRPHDEQASHVSVLQFRVRVRAVQRLAARGLGGEIAIEGENATYAPRVLANQFLTVAKKYYGLDPPD